MLQNQDIIADLNDALAKLRVIKEMLHNQTVRRPPGRVYSSEMAHSEPKEELYQKTNKRKTH